MEIERQFLICNIENMGIDIESYTKKHYSQAYISTSPAIRLRDEDGRYVLCVKGKGTMVREEFELPLSKEQYDSLWKKIETSVISKNRYFIPIENGHIAELDIYLGDLHGLVTVEVEFESEAEANIFVPPCWFGKEVTNDARYKNSSLAVHGLPDNL